MKRILSLLFLGLVVVVGLVPQTAKADEIVTGKSTQYVSLTNMGGGNIDVTFGACSVSGCTLSGTTIPSGTYTLTTADTPFEFTYSGLAEDFNPTSANTFTATVDGVTSTDASYTLMYSDGGVDFDGTWLPGDQPFDMTLNKLIWVSGSNHTIPTSNYLLTLASRPVGTTWKATVSSGEFTTPEPVSMLLFGSFLSLAGGWLGRKKRA